MNKIQYDKKRLTEAGVVILALVTAAAVGTGSHGKQDAKEERSYEKGRQTAVVLENKRWLKLYLLIQQIPSIAHTLAKNQAQQESQC